MRKNEVPACYEDELILFYNKYLSIGLGEGYLSGLINRCATLWLKKEIPEDKKLTAKNLRHFSINSKDYARLPKLDQDFINFFYRTYMRIDDKYGVIMDSLGNIEAFNFDGKASEVEMVELNQNIGLNIFTFLNKLVPGLNEIDKREEAENYILQNILSSKIYKAIYEKIMQEGGIVKASIFALANAEIMEYEDKLKENLDYENIFPRKAAYSRSRR